MLLLVSVFIRLLILFSCYFSIALRADGVVGQPWQPRHQQEYPDVPYRSFEPVAVLIRVR